MALLFVANTFFFLSSSFRTSTHCRRGCRRLADVISHLEQSIVSGAAKFTTHRSVPFTGVPLTALFPLRQPPAPAPLHLIFWTPLRSAEVGCRPDPLRFPLRSHALTYRRIWQQQWRTRFGVYRARGKITPPRSNHSGGDNWSHSKAQQPTSRRSNGLSALSNDRRATINTRWVFVCVMSRCCSATAASVTNKQDISNARASIIWLVDGAKAKV